MINSTGYAALVDDNGTNTTGTPITKALLLSLFAPYRCVAYHNATQSATSAVFTVLSMNSEDIDVTGMHDTVTNNSRITIPAGAAGTYLMIGVAYFAANTSGQRQVAIYKNGAILDTVVAPAPSGVATLRLQIQYVGTASVADYFEVAAYQDSGGALNIGSASRLLGNALTLVQVA